MRFTTVLSFLATSIAVLSPVYAAPLPTEAGSAVTKRCLNGTCKDAIVTPSTSDSTQGSLTVQELVKALIDTLTSLEGVPTANNTAVNVVTPSSAGGPSSDGTTKLAHIIGVAL